MWRRCLTVMSWRWSEISWDKCGHCLVSSRICKLDSRVEWMILIETYWNHKPTHSANTETLWDNLGLQKRPSTMRGIVRYWQFKSFVWVPYVKWHTHTQLTMVPIGGLWLQVVWANEDHSWNDFQDATVLVTVKRPAPRQKNRMRNNQSPQIQTEAHKT